MILKQVIKYSNANAIEATWVDTDGTNKVIAYADVQMQMFRDDVALFGGNITDYEALIAQIEAGIQPVQPAPIVIPQSVTRFQALAALHLADKLTAVQAIMAAPETPVLAKLAWDNALSFERTSPTLASLAAMLGMTDADLDALFTTAATIEA